MAGTRLAAAGPATRAPAQQLPLPLPRPTAGRRGGDSCFLPRARGTAFRLPPPLLVFVLVRLVLWSGESWVRRGVDPVHILEISSFLCQIDRWTVFPFVTLVAHRNNCFSFCRLFRPCCSSTAGHFSTVACAIKSNGCSKVTRVLFCGPYFPASMRYTTEYLRDYPFIEADEVGLDQVPHVIQNYHICVVKNRRIDSDIIAKATQMKIIMQYGVGLEGVDVNAATEHKIKVARIPGSMTGNAVSCAEMAIYLTLGVLRKQKLMDAAVHQKDLGSPTGETIFVKTVLILGFGAIGVEIAKRLKAFGVKILATKRNWSPGSLPCHVDGLVDKKGRSEDMYEFAGEADIVITCLLQTNETVGIIDDMFISVMKKGSCLVNIARGGLLDYKAVFNHLESGHLGGFGVDVAWTEPFDPEDPILKFSNVIITPHVAGVTEYSYRTMAQVVGDVALQLHLGETFTGIEFVN